MRRIVPAPNQIQVNAGDIDRICQVILRDAWKLSGCGLGQGAHSCALFLGEYGWQCDRPDMTDQIQELFDRGCNGVVSGKTGWLDFADLALATQRLSILGYIDVEQQHFFEDIDKLAITALAGCEKVAGFANSDLGAALYCLRRLKGGALTLSPSIQQFCSKLTCQDAAALVCQTTAGSLRDGFCAAVLLVAAAVETGHIATGPHGAAALVDILLESSAAQQEAQVDPGLHTGELGRGYALLRAGMSFGQGNWITAGLQIAIDCARWVLDHGIALIDIASGAAGIAAAFEKIYRLTGFGIFSQAAARVKWLIMGTAVSLPGIDIDCEYSFYNGLIGTGISALHWQKNQQDVLEELAWLI